MAKVYQTPGVYIEEGNAFPNSAVPVATAVPAFIGYTEKAERIGEPLHLQPTRISSYGEYQQFFGGAPTITFTLSASEDPNVPYELAIKDYYFTLHNQMKMFFSNGGTDCYIVSVGGYTNENGNPNTISLEALRTGIEPLIKEVEPTMLVIPEAVHAHVGADSIDEDVAAIGQLNQDMLAHCGFEMKSRFAITDVWMNVDEFEKPGYKMEADLTRYRNNIGNNNLMWGAAYYPWLHTSAVAAADVGLHNIDATSDLKPNPGDKMYNAVMTDIRKRLNLLPPSAAMAGVYSMVDNQVGVFQSPANISVGSVVAPALNINSEQQEDMNVPISGKAINAIRSFPGKGVLVWGARTLDGNSQDWRYISVRRTVIFIEQSIKAAVEPYFFEPNTASTWSNMKAMLTNFLTNVWQMGGLAGATPEDAFSVDVGLGSTMTAVDILDGYMRISVKIAVSRPAEFIVITFEQKMQQA